MIDLHAHILPGIDDGPSDMREAIALCRVAAQDGCKAIVATPHMCNSLYRVTRADVLEGVARLQQAVNEANVSLRLFPGADVLADDALPSRVRTKEVLTVADNGKYLMVEISQDVVPPRLAEMFFSLQLLGVTPIVTHPERNVAIQEDENLLVPWVLSGNLVQLTAASIVGGFGKTVERCAWRLIERRLAHLVASDAHSLERRPTGLSAARRAVARALGEDEATEIFQRRPERIVAGAGVSVPEPIVEPRRRGWRGIWPWPRR